MKVIFHLIPLIYLMMVSKIIGGEFQGLGVLRMAGFCAGFVIIAVGVDYTSTRFNASKLPTQVIGQGGLLALALIFLASGNTTLAWLGLATWMAGLVLVARRLAWASNIIMRAITYLLLAAWAGMLPVSINQLQVNFSDEEFYTILTAVLLSVLWLLLLLPASTWIPSPEKNIHRSSHQSLILGLLYFFITGLVSLGTIIRYQHSFFADSAPLYPGINTTNPFSCIPSEPNNIVFSGQAVFDKIQDLIEANPAKGSPEFAALAIGSMDRVWAEQYRKSILQEANQSLFTQPANSIKAEQFEASLRLYFYLQMQKAFPDLLSTHEQAAILTWFQAINRRAQTVEWVDWLYALSYAKPPEGPYENQETGAGLLALLESSQMGDPALSDKNRGYLENNPRGWAERFRNTDDAAYYQPHWLYNAFFQSMYTGVIDAQNLQNSLRWLLLQAYPDGSALRYNHVGAATLADTPYWGASLTNDEQLMWLAGQAADYVLSQGGYIDAMPGDEVIVSIDGKSPDFSSCVLFGDSGLPNQLGPLAADKIVLRDGWEQGSTALLLNLRFSGWHRYKATNSIINLYQNGSILAENLSGDTSRWLPEGRLLFRDKRVPRENLNAFQIHNSGLSLVIYQLLGVGSGWAQDPPHYAQVQHFAKEGDVMHSRSVISNWRGWDQNRSIYLAESGPVVIVDQATGPAGQTAAIAWQVQTFQPLATDRYLIRLGSNPVEMVILQIDQGGQPATPHPKVEVEGRVIYDQPSGASLITVILSNDWLGAEVYVDPVTLLLHINKGALKMVVPIESGLPPPHKSDSTVPTPVN